MAGHQPTSSTYANEKDSGWFPSWFLWPLFFVTLAVRVHYVMQPTNWWLHHPDEVFQALEVAHSEVYGYGFRAYEYNPPPDVGPDSPPFARLEEKHGMAALRSYLLPQFYISVSWILDLLGLSFNPFLTWKVAHTMAASTLPLAVFRYARVVFRSRDTACLAAMLCAASGLLTVLGTHTLVNSLLSAPVFLVLAHLHPLIHPAPTHTQSEASDRDQVVRDINHNRKSLSKHAARNNRASSSPSSSSSFPANGHPPPQQASGKNQSSKSKGKQKPNKLGQKQKWTPPPVGTNRGSAVISNGTVVEHESKDETGTTENPHHTTTSNGQRHTNNGTALQFSNNTHSVQNGSATTRDLISSLKQKSARLLGNVVAGLVLGVCVYIRVDMAALVVLALLPHWRPWSTRYSDVIVCGLGAACGVAVGVAEDFRCYGWGVVTPVNWFRFNVQRDYSALIFGTSGLHQYVLDIFLDNVGMLALSVLCLLCGAMHVLDSLQGRGVNVDAGSRPAVTSADLAKTCSSWLLLLALYSSKGHKELRFAHNVIVLVLITWAVLLRQGVLRLTPCPRRQRAALGLVLAVFALSQWSDVTSLTAGGAKRGSNKMAFKLSGDSQDVNQCMYYLSSRPDLTGVFIDRNLYSTGGYSLLHRDVPVFTIFGPNFMEFRKEDRRVERTKNWLGPRRNISVSYTGKFSNFISPKHSLHVFKYVLQDPRYNYIVSYHDKSLEVFGFGEAVYRCGVFKVYHRAAKPSAQQRKQIQDAVNSKAPADVTTLLHEADMLLFHGAYRKATDRFRLVLTMDPDQVGAYLPLAAAYQYLGELEEGLAVLEECSGRFSLEACEKKRRPMITSEFTDS